MTNLSTIDIQSPAAKSFYREVRDFALRTKPWQTANFYFTKPDEAYDLTLVSERVYGNRNEFLTVMAAAGLDSVDMPLPQKRLVLPTASQLQQIKQRTGFESQAAYRENGAPVWST